jgi:pimeloyl-ACP methyl ester carboxylesterase
MTNLIEHSYIETNGIRLHVAQAGPADGPLVILLHGFPEFWYGWRRQIEPLARAGYRVWAPDQRGYNLSDKPKGLAAYDITELSKDVVGLVDAAGRQKCILVGHDWGAAVAWVTALVAPERLDKLAILNVPHPVVMARTLRGSGDQVRRLAQLRKSWYMFFFQLPLLPEAMLRANDWAAAVELLRRSSRPGSFTDEDFEQYRRAWWRKEAFTSMLNWYRAVISTASPAGRPDRAPPDAGAVGQARCGAEPRNGPAQHRPVRRRPAYFLRECHPLGAA